MVMQVINRLHRWFEAEIPERVRPHLRPYTIMCTGCDAGLVECVLDSKSLDEVKKQTDGFTSLRDYFERAYGPPGGEGFRRAQDNFLRSLVGYSLVCYVLQIKDRHNANILLSREGHLMHIDFGFVLGNVPKMGRVPIFSERAPFKLSSEFLEVIGGCDRERGGLFEDFCEMFGEAFACASSHSEEIATLVESTIINLRGDRDSARTIADDVRGRLQMRGGKLSEMQQNFIISMIESARTCWRTSTYDWLQKSMNGYQ